MAWLERVRQEVPGAYDLDAAAILNSFPNFLQVLSELVSTTSGTNFGERASIEVVESARHHGITRSEQPAYTLDQVISEYRILRCILLSILEASGGLAPRERDKILEAIDYGIIEASVQFTEALGFARSRTTQKETEGLKTELSNSRRDVVKIAFQRDQAQARSEELERISTDLYCEREIREKFVSTLSHDLRNPLTVALMRAQLVLKQAEPNSPTKTLGIQLIRDLERIERMVNDLLDANLLCAGGRLPLRRSEVDLSALVRSVLDELILTNGDRFQFHAPTTLKAFVDPSGIRRIIENLCNNAVKYGAPGAARIVVSMRETTESNVELSVHNEGEPIPPTDQISLFDQFRRTEKAISGGKKGWGLGLALVKGMAEAHEGSVKVESARDKGTTFTVNFPRDVRDPKNGAA